jgi:hypothetical protein
MTTDKLITALLKMACQYLMVDRDANDAKCYLFHWHMGAGEYTLDLLEELGYIEAVKERPEHWKFTDKAIKILDESL